MRFVPLIPIAGCGLFGLDPVPDSGDSQSVSAPCAGLCVRAVSPDYGPLAGGTLVEIQGEGFGDSPQVMFGNQALDVQVLDEGRVLVSSPEAKVAGGVDVTVQVGDLKDTLYDAFTYVSGDGGGDTGGDDNSGLVSGLVEMNYFVIGCPACFGLTEGLDYSVAAAFHPPESGSWYDWMPAVGSCASNAQSAPLSSQTLDVGERVYLATGGASLVLRGSSSGGSTVYSASGLAYEDWVSDSSWDLDVPDAEQAFTVDHVALTPSGFDDIQPIAVLNDGNKAFTASISRSNARFSWSPAGVADAFVLRLEIYNSAGSSYLGSVLCHSADNGSLTVPSSMLSAYPARALVAVWMYRFQQSSGTRSDDGSTVESAVSFGLLGTGTLQ